MNPASAYTANMAAAFDALALVGYFSVWLIASVVTIALVEFVSRAINFHRMNRHARRTSPPSGAPRRSAPAVVPGGHGDASRLFAEAVNRYHFTHPDELADHDRAPLPAKPLLSGQVPEQGRGHAQR